MVKELINIEMERDNMQQKWGFTVQVKKMVNFVNLVVPVIFLNPNYNFRAEQTLP